MPRTRSLAWSELKIGVLTIFALVIVAITIFMLTGGKGFFWQRYSLKTRFSNVAGLKPGSPVRVAGKEVGSVTEIEFAGEQIDVTFQVNKEIRDKITTESIATLGSVSLLGEGAVDVTPSSAGTPVPEWGYVKAGRTPRADCRHHRPGEPGDGDGQPAGRRHQRRPGHGREAADRRSALHRTAAVRRRRERDGAQRPGRDGARSASC